MEAEKCGHLSLPVSSSVSVEEREEICGVPSTLIMASLLPDKDKGPRYSPWTHTRGQGAQTLWVSFPPSRRGGKNTGTICELPSC